MHLPLSLKALPDIPEGKELLSAISAVQKYEKENPTWFTDRFGPAIPALTPLVFQVSHTDSDYYSLSPGQSVSSQDVTSLDQMGSPTSPCEVPNFKGYLNHSGSTKSNLDGYPQSTMKNVFSSEIESQPTEDKDQYPEFDDRSVITVPSLVGQELNVKLP